jgi:mono/diheme cytochrome c family protein
VAEKIRSIQDAFFLISAHEEAVMVKSSLLLSAGIIVALVPGCLLNGQAAGKNATAASDLARAKSIYQIDCSVCHGDTGNGKTDLATSMTLTLNDWTDPKSLADKSDADLFKVIRDGKDKMPPEEAGRAKDDDVKSLVLYIRNFSKTQAGAQPAGTPTAQK